MGAADTNVIFTSERREKTTHTVLRFMREGNPTRPILFTFWISMWISM
jgi:hypothetical protein